MSRTVTKSVLALAAMALSLACSKAKPTFTVTDEVHAQPPAIIAQKLYDQVDQSWATTT